MTHKNKILSSLLILSTILSITCQNITNNEECILAYEPIDTATGDSVNIPTNGQLLVTSYGTDLSFPMHSASVSTNYPWLPHNKCINNPTPEEYVGMPLQVLGDKQSVYENYVEGCRKRYPGNECDVCEETRIAMNVRQPQSMVNYTDLGFKKLRAPEGLMEVLYEFWDKNKDKKSPEGWAPGNCYVNHWENMSYMASVEDRRLEGGGAELKQMIWDAAEGIVQEWTNHEKMKTSSLYGIRVYEEGAILATHVDRLPLVSSAIINVDQDVDEPWPLEVIGHDGKAYNVTMEPGDMVLYESHSILHGRPFPLKGRFFANVFIHFAPEQDLDPSDGRPSYVLRGSPEHTRLRRSGQTIAHDNTNKPKTTDGNNAAHAAAARGDLMTLKILEKQDRSSILRKDANGWTPLFEAARSGKLEILKFLIYHGQDVFQLNKNGNTAYEIAEEHNEVECMKYIRNVWYEKQWGYIPNCLK